jgi:hypothetical protein
MLTWCVKDRADRLPRHSLSPQHITRGTAFDNTPGEVMISPWTWRTLVSCVLHVQPILLLCFELHLLTLWRYSSCRTMAASHILCEVSWQQIFTGWGRQPHAQLPTWRTRVSVLVWYLPWNLSCQAPAALCPGERTPGTHCIGGWVGLRAGLDTEVRGKILCLCRESNLDRLVVQPIPYITLTELPG